MKLDVCTRCHRVLSDEGGQITGRMKRRDLLDCTDTWYRRKLHWCASCAELFEAWHSAGRREWSAGR